MARIYMIDIMVCGRMEAPTHCARRPDARALAGPMRDSLGGRTSSAACFSLGIVGQATGLPCPTGTLLGQRADVVDEHDAVAGAHGQVQAVGTEGEAGEA